MSYRDKYLKYKNKYLKAVEENQIAESESYYDISETHVGGKPHQYPIQVIVNLPSQLGNTTIEVESTDTLDSLITKIKEQIILKKNQELQQQGQLTLTEAQQNNIRRLNLKSGTTPLTDMSKKFIELPENLVSNNNNNNVMSINCNINMMNPVNNN